MNTGVGGRVLRAAAVMGLSGLLAQLLLLRELLIVFAGNELSIGLILAGWLFSEAAGSLWARRARTQGAAAAVNSYAWVSTVFCLCLIPALYSVRMIKPLLGISVGTVPGLGAAALAALPALLPVGMSHGALFTLGCAVLAQSQAERAPAGRLYIIETVGTVCAGLLWTAALIRVANPFLVVTGIMLLNAGTVAYLLRGIAAGSGAAAKTRTQRVAMVATASLFLVGLSLPATGAGSWLHERSVNALWRNQHIVRYENTLHGNIVITENEGQYAFFTDGTPSFLVPVPDIDLVESLVHIPLTAHPEPRRVMLIGGGASGFLDAILQHRSVSSVVYTEADERLLQLQLEHAEATGELWPEDPRVETYAADARTRLQMRLHRYDVIISRSSDPANLHSSRYFSSEFFRVAAAGLTEHGILVLSFPALIGHLNEPLRDLAAGVYGGLQQEFPYVRAFPGARQSFFVASFDPAVLRMEPNAFMERLQQRGLMGMDALPWQIEQHLHPGRSAWFQNYVSGSTARPSRDFRPSAMLLSISHWSTLNAPLAGRFLQAVYRIPPLFIPPALGAVLLLPALAGMRRSRQGRTAVIPAVVTTGFSAMLVNLSLLFAFQILAGRLFGWLGLLTAAFIAGLGLGAVMTSMRLATYRNNAAQLLSPAEAAGRPYRLLIQTELAILLFSTLLLLLLPLLAPALSARVPATVLRLMFIPLLLAAGAVCGSQFPVACAVLSGSAGDHGSTTGGLVYGADLLGGCVGGILGGVLVLPLLGFAGAGVSIALLKTVSFFLLRKFPEPSILRA